MSKKNYMKFYNSLFFKKVTTHNFIKAETPKVPKLTNLQPNSSPILNNTGKFFKKIALIGLALNNVLFAKYRTLTTKSLILSLWNMIATYVIIF